MVMAPVVTTAAAGMTMTIQDAATVMTIEIMVGIEAIRTGITALHNQL